MAKYETMTIPEFVEDPNTKNEDDLDYEEMADPFDSRNGELVDKKEVKNINIKTIHKFLNKVNKGILA